MTVRGSPQRHPWEVDVQGQPRLLRRLISAVMAIAQSQNQATLLRAAGVSRRQRGACNMNATATSAPAGPQNMRALQRANEVRLARAQLKRGVAFGEIDVAEVIVDCPWEAQSMAVADLLMSQRRWGQTRCHKLLARLPMSEQKTVGSMTDRQRHALAAMLSSAEGRGWSATP